MAGWPDQTARRPHRSGAVQWWLPWRLAPRPPAAATADLRQGPSRAGYRRCASIAPSARRNFRKRSLPVLLSVAAAGKLRFRRLTAALDEGPLDMMFGDEPSDNFCDVGRHWHGFDKIAAGIGERLAFGRISGYGKDLIRSLRRTGSFQLPQKAVSRARPTEFRQKPIPVATGNQPTRFSRGAARPRRLLQCSRER